MTSEPADVLLLGDPGLRTVSRAVADIADPAFIQNRERLHATLATFREQHGFGRAISAPQIGVTQRFIALNLGEGPFTMINPAITWWSHDQFTMWDDCMSFPDLLVRVRRHRSVSVRYTDERGETVNRGRLAPAYSELLQHEIDHLDGVLAIDRALGRESLVSRSVFEANPEHFAEQVDWGQTTN